MSLLLNDDVIASSLVGIYFPDQLVYHVPSASLEDPSITPFLEQSVLSAPTASAVEFRSISPTFKKLQAVVIAAARVFSSLLEVLAP